MLYLLDEMDAKNRPAAYTEAELDQADCNDEGLSLNELLKKYAQSKTGAQIAEMAGCGLSVVYYRAKQLGINIKKPPANYDSDKVTHLVRKYAGIKTSAELAKMTGASKSTIKARAVRLGLSLRRSRC